MWGQLCLLFIFCKNHQFFQRILELCLCSCCPNVSSNYELILLLKPIVYLIFNTAYQSYRGNLQNIEKYNGRYKKWRESGILEGKTKHYKNGSFSKFNLYTWCGSSCQRQRSEFKMKITLLHVTTLPENSLWRGRAGDNWRGQESQGFFIVSKIRET